MMGMTLEWTLPLLHEMRKTSIRRRMRPRNVLVKKSPYSKTKMQATGKMTVRRVKKISLKKSRTMVTTAKVAVKKVMPTQRRKTMLLNP